MSAMACCLSSAGGGVSSSATVSYTHLDVYKRQVLSCSNQEAVSADGTNIVNLKVGVRTLIGKHNSFYVGFGQALTHSVWYEHIVRAEYRYSF